MPTVHTSAWHDQWEQLDHSSDPSFFVDFLDYTRGGQRIVAQNNPQQFSAHLSIEPGQHILEVACGTGDLTAPLAQLVGPEGLVVGLDKSKTMVLEARKRAGKMDLPLKNMEGDVYALAIRYQTVG